MNSSITKFAFFPLALLTLVLSTHSLAKPAAAPATPIRDFHAPKDAVILIIRHAEKPDAGPDLSLAGQQRALAYVSYFKSFNVDSKPLALEALFATADSKESRRPRLTIEPLSQSMHLRIRDQFKNRDFEKIAADISSKSHEKNVLICWHHGEIPELLRALGADPEKLLPKGKWPSEEFGWVLQLRYDHDGRLISDQTVRIDENLKLATPR